MANIPRQKTRKETPKKGARDLGQYLPNVSLGFGTERDYFMENLSLLFSSGMGISAALDSLARSARTRRMKRCIADISAMVGAGVPLWSAIAKAKLVPERAVSLIRSGEEAGRLAEHLNLATIQRRQEKLFQARLRSALLYPGIVLTLAAVIALCSAWLILPKLIAMFVGSTVRLPLSTRVLIVIGRFLEIYGAVVVPAALAFLGLSIYGLFFFRRTKFIGDAMLFGVPGVKELMQGIELARFGHVMGMLLQAGFPIGEALESAKKGAEYDSYRKFYEHLEVGVGRGESFGEAMAGYPKTEKYVPYPIQQLISSAEKSGRLPETFLRVGVIFESKTDAMSRDLTSVLEPIVLIVVGLVVTFVVLAIIGPIYEMSGQI